jgi:L-seryl-tRNA(Ser) seleniumtransferase
MKEALSVNELVETSSASLPREIKTFIAKEVLLTNKDPKNATDVFIKYLENIEFNQQKQVVNASGTILHTNLGRAPVEINNASRYSNIEYDLVKNQRGERNPYLNVLMKLLLGAEDVAFVNNNASSLYIALRMLKQKYNIENVIISRGEIIEIGGSYRLPEIILESDLKLIEVGTTNKTKAKDYETALLKNQNSILLKVHRSNYSISGFTEETTIEELNSLKIKHNTFLIHDLGSGLVVDDNFLNKYNLNIFSNEPKVQDSIKSGVDIVMFSGDKLFGSAQSGILAGKETLIKDIKSFSLFRTYRCSGSVLYELENTAVNYVSKNELEIPFWRLISEKYEVLKNRIEKVVENSNFIFQILDGESVIGGGTLPNKFITSPILEIEGNPESILKKLINLDVPIIPRIQNNKVILDFRSVFPDQDIHIKNALQNL